MNSGQHIVKPTNVTWRSKMDTWLDIHNPRTVSVLDVAFTLWYGIGGSNHLHA
jgi:hypothetical protein